MARKNPNAGDAMARAKAAIARMEIVTIGYSCGVTVYGQDGQTWTRIASLLRLAADAADAAAKDATED